MKEINCIFCGIPSTKVLIEENGYTGKQCPECDLIYISPRPTFSEIVDLYGHDDAHLTAENHITSEYSKRLHAKHTLNIIEKYINSGPLLEVGSGAGYFLDEANKRGFEPYGIEFNAIQAEHIRETIGLPCVEKPLSESIYAGKKFDLIYHCDVISHLYEPIDDFKRMNDLLNDGGYLVFETGNLGEIDVKYLKLIRSFMYPDHLFFFNTKNLDILLSSTGFQIIKIERYSLMLFLHFLRGIGKVRELLRKLLRRNKSIAPNTGEKYTTQIPESENSGGLTLKMSTPKNNRIDNAGRLFRHLLRYLAGKLPPKTRRPQTMIVIAQKKSA